MLRAFSIQDTELLNQWAGSQDELFQFSGTTWQYPLSEEMLSQYMAKYPNRYMYLYEVSGSLIGFGELITQEDNSPRLSRLLIAPMYRGQGHGKKLVSELETLCDADHISLFVLENNARARKCYESCGYTYTDYEKFSLEHNQEQHPVLKMSKAL
ncbi:MAG: GNAT family N-acetyltransferase [Chitinophagaceae bacterium]